MTSKNPKATWDFIHESLLQAKTIDTTKFLPHEIFAKSIYENVRKFILISSIDFVVEIYAVQRSVFFFTFP